jgi:hypothetical protein
MSKLLILFALPVALLANEITDTRTPTRRGGGGEGKCTIEVEVDDTAEVEIRGNQAQIRTLSGNAARFRRFECNQDIPENPNDFRFQGIEGRGRQTLVRMPGGRGPAVIRIEDPKGGSHGYTFDIFWRGVAGPWNNSNGNGGGGTGIFGGGGGGFGGGGNWDRGLNFQGRGNGAVRTNAGFNPSIANCRVSINRRGNVEVTLETESLFSIQLTGRVTRTDGNMVYADMNGVNVSGPMEIETDGNNRVRRIQMRSGFGRNGFEIDWRN